MNKLLKFILGFLVVLSLAFTVLAVAPTIDTTYPDTQTISINEGDSQEFNITASDVDGDISLYEWYLNGILVSSGATTTSYIYTSGYNDSGSHTVMVNVSDATGESAAFIWNLTINNVNRAPVLGTITDQIMTAGSLNSFTVTASDEDIVYGDSLTFSISNNALTVTKVDDTSATISWTPTNDDAGAYLLNMSVTDSFGATDTNSFTLTVNEAPSKLIISDLDVEIDGEKDKNLNDGETITENAKPGSVVELYIKVTNEYDFDLRDVKVEATLRSIGEDNDNLEEESDEFDLDDGEDEKVALKFDIPLKVEDKTYTITIDVRGKDRNGTRYSTEWTIYLEVDKEKHNIVISKAYLNPTNVGCENSVSLDFEITNIGRNREDEVVVEIRNNELGLLYKETEIKLDEDIDEEDNDYSGTISFEIPSDLEVDIYPIVIKVYYDTERLSDTKTLSLVKEECSEVVEPEEDVEIIIKEPEQKGAETPKEISFEYMLFLVAASVIALGLLVYGAAYLVTKK